MSLLRIKGTYGGSEITFSIPRPVDYRLAKKKTGDIILQGQYIVRHQYGEDLAVQFEWRDIPTVDIW